MSRINLLLTSLTVLALLAFVGCDNSSGGRRNRNPVNPVVNPNGPNQPIPIQQGSYYSGYVEINRNEQFRYEDFLNYMMRLCRIDSRSRYNNCESWADGGKIDLVFNSNQLPTDANVTFIAFDERTRDFFNTSRGPLFQFDNTAFRFRHFTYVPVTPSRESGTSEIRIRNFREEMTLELRGQPGSRYLDGSLIFEGVEIATVRFDLMGSFNTFFSQYSSNYQYSSSYSYRYSSRGYSFSTF